MIAETLTSFAKITNRLAQLAKSRAKFDFDTFSTFVAPVMTDVAAMHTYYLKSYRRYLNEIGDLSIRMSLDHPVLAEVQRNSVLSRNLQTQAFKLTLTKRDCFESRLRPFAVSIGRYFFILGLGPGYFEQVSPLNTYPMDCSCESSRFTTLFTIAGSEASDDVKRADARKALTSSLEILEDRYKVISMHFSELGSELHKPW